MKYKETRKSKTLVGNDISNFWGKVSQGHFSLPNHSTSIYNTYIASGGLRISITQILATVDSVEVELYILTGFISSYG